MTAGDVQFLDVLCAAILTERLLGWLFKHPAEKGLPQML